MQVAVARFATSEKKKLEMIDRNFIRKYATARRRTAKLERRITRGTNESVVRKETNRDAWKAGPV